MSQSADLPSFHHGPESEAAGDLGKGGGGVDHIDHGGIPMMGISPYSSQFLHFTTR